MDQKVFIKEWYTQNSLPNIPKGEFFPCLIWAYSTVSTDNKKELITSLINSGCKFFICGDYDYQSWENAADDIIVSMALEKSLENPNFDNSPMTTTYKGGPDVDAIFELLNITQIRDYSYKNYVIILVNPKTGDREKMEQIIQKYDY